MVRWRKLRLAPVISAFVWGVLTGLGIDPAQMIVESAAEQIGPYFQIAAIMLFVIVLYFSYSWIIEGIKRSRRAFRLAGVIGIVAIILAFLAGFYVFTWEKATLVLLVAVVAWAYAVWR